MLTGHDVASGLGRLLLSSITPHEESRSFRRVIVDSRQAAAGDLFVALPGEHTDGHRHIADALQRGATGTLAKAWPLDLPGEVKAGATLFQVPDPLVGLHALACAWRRRFRARVIGVTGSVGKTSTKEAIAGVLAQRFEVLESSGNRNTEIGLPLALLELRQEHQRTVLEMAMHTLGDIALLCRLAQPSTGVVTNIGPTHLERLGSLERIADAKAELVESLPAEGVAILNADDPRVAPLAQRTRARTVTYGLDAQAMCRAEELATHGLKGISFRLCWEERGLEVHTPLHGRHSAYTALAAAAVGLTEGLSLEEVAAGLKTLKGGSRVRVRWTPQGTTVLDDTYNASPISMKAALDLLGEMPGKKVAVLGDMLELGSYEEEGHREVGQHAAAVVDVLYAIGPRAAGIAAGARSSGLTQVRHLAEQEAAEPALRELLSPEVFLLLKASRGMALDALANRLCGA